MDDLFYITIGHFRNGICIHNSEKIIDTSIVFLIILSAYLFYVSVW